MTSEETPREAGSGARVVPLFSAGSASLKTTVALNVARSLAGASSALAIGVVVDRFVAAQQFLIPLLWVAALLGFRAIISLFAPILATTTALRVESDLRERALRAVLRVGPWSGRRTGETVARATEGIDAVGALGGTFLPQLISGISVPILLAAVVAIIDLPTAAVLVLIIPSIPLLLRMLEKRFASVSARYRATADQLAARFLDGIQGLRTLNTLGRADAYGDGIAVEAERLRAETMGLLKVNQLALLAVDTLFMMGTVGAAAVMAAIRLSGGAISVGQAVAIILLGVMLIDPLSQIGRFFYVGAIGRAAAADVRSLLGESTGFQKPPRPFADVAVGSVEFDRVGFVYPDGTRAVDSVTFSIQPGERIALVGPSGAGKTTIAHLVLGLLEPDTGSVVVGGRPVLVPQRPYLFYGSVADNLRIARPDAKDAELWSVLESVELANVISDRSDGLHTQVGERGLRLSGGEAQLLAVARALIVDSPLVVLDEPTSNVDLESEARVRTAIDRLTEGRTVLVIAHRESTVAGVDRVVFLEAGRVVTTLPGNRASHYLRTRGES